jgi:hypothetical protein
MKIAMIRIRPGVSSLTSPTTGTSSSSSSYPSFGAIIEDLGTSHGDDRWYLSSDFVIFAASITVLSFLRFIYIGRCPNRIFRKSADKSVQ